MPRSLSKNSVVYTHSLSATRSFAGKLGMASRWHGHKKKKTKLVRIYEDDYNFVSDRFISVDGVYNSFASFFHSASYSFAGSSHCSNRLPKKDR